MISNSAVTLYLFSQALPVQNLIRYYLLLAAYRTQNCRDNFSRWGPLIALNNGQLCYLYSNSKEDNQEGLFPACHLPSYFLPTVGLSPPYHSHNCSPCPISKTFHLQTHSRISKIIPSFMCGIKMVASSHAIWSFSVLRGTVSIIFNTLFRPKKCLLISRSVNVTVPSTLPKHYPWCAVSTWIIFLLL